MTRSTAKAPAIIPERNKTMVSDANTSLAILSAVSRFFVMADNEVNPQPVQY
jgi:hypothetical protein